MADARDCRIAFVECRNSRCVGIFVSADCRCRGVAHGAEQVGGHEVERHGVEQVACGCREEHFVAEERNVLIEAALLVHFQHPVAERCEFRIAACLRKHSSVGVEHVVGECDCRSVSVLVCAVYQAVVAGKENVVAHGHCLHRVVEVASHVVLVSGNDSRVVGDVDIRSYAVDFDCGRRVVAALHRHLVVDDARAFVGCRRAFAHVDADCFHTEVDVHCVAFHDAVVAELQVEAVESARQCGCVVLNHVAADGDVVVAGVCREG